MNSAFFQLLLLLFITSCTNKHERLPLTQIDSSKLITPTYSEDVSTDEKFMKTWNQFALCIINKDLQRFRNLSTDCIACFSCCTKNESGEYQVVENRFIPISSFIRDHYSMIFSKTTRARLLDTAKCSPIESGYNTEVYNNSCISNSKKVLTNPKFKEMLVLVVDPSTEYEGTQQAFAFIETKDGYKFCGYSTIP